MNKIPNQRLLSKKNPKSYYDLSLNLVKSKTSHNKLSKNRKIDGLDKCKNKGHYIHKLSTTPSSEIPKNFIEFNKYNINKRSYNSNNIHHMAPISKKHSNIINAIDDNYDNYSNYNKLSKFYDLHKNVTLDHKSVNFKEQYFKDLLTQTESNYDNIISRSQNGTNADTLTENSDDYPILINPNQYVNIEFSDTFSNKKKKKNDEELEKLVRININKPINDIDDILNLIEEYPDSKDVKYNINMSALHNIKTPLKELNNMVGMENLKKNILDQLLYFIQDLHTKTKEGDFLHTVIYGKPGTGKTEVAKLIGQIYSKLGILKNNKFKKVTRVDLVAGYLGQTAIKTKDLIKDSIGGVLFIDEAYSLGNQEKRDSFSKEAIDTLCESLSDHKKDLMVIIAGYEDELNDCFFSYNKGLESRFNWRFKTDDYDYKNLFQIFKKKVRESEWSIAEDSIKDDWFKQNHEYFEYYGRDIETLFSKIKISHSRRVFCLDETEKTKLNLEDLENGFKNFLENEQIKNRKTISKKDNFINMYN